MFYHQMTPLKIFLLLLILSSGLVTHIYGQQKYLTAVVGFYNLENLFDTILHSKNDDASFTPQGSKSYTSKVFDDKIDKLSKVISEMGTDFSPDGAAILGVAEVENISVLQVLTNHFRNRNRNYKILHYESRDIRGIDVALLYNPKYFRVESSRPLYVRLPGGSKTSYYTRDILWVTGYLLGEKVELFVNHWPSRYGGEKRSMPARMAAASIVRGVIDNIISRRADAKIIVMGDFNDDPLNESITKGLRAKGNPPKLGKEDLYNPWVELYKSGYGTLAYQDAWSLFDQIIVSQPFLDKRQEGLFLYKNEIFKREYLIENIGRYKGYPMRTYSGEVYRGGYSDHFPTFLVLLKKVAE